SKVGGSFYAVNRYKGIQRLGTTCKELLDRQRRAIMPTGYIWDYPDYFHLTHLERQFFEVCRKLVEEGFTYDYAEPSGAPGCRVKYIQFKLPNQSGFLSEKVRNLLK